MVDLITHVEVRLPSPKDFEEDCQVMTPLGQCVKIFEETEKFEFLEGFITSHPVEVLQRLETLSYYEQENLSKPLLRLARSQDKSNELVRLALRQTIENCKDSNTLFRESSLSTILFGEFHQSVGLNYLRSLITPLYLKVISSPECALFECLSKENQGSGLSMKADERRVKKMSNFMKKLVSEFMICLNQSWSEIPFELANMYRFVYLECKNKFSGSKIDELNHSIMVTFFFLRFLVPSLPRAHKIVSPYSITSSARNHRTGLPNLIKFSTSTNDVLSTDINDDLELSSFVSKEGIKNVLKELSLIVQKISSNSKFPANSWRSTFNQFIVQAQTPLQIFINQVLQTPELTKRRKDDLVVLMAFLKPQEAG